ANKAYCVFYNCIHPLNTIPIIYTAVKMKIQTTSKKCQYKLTINNLCALSLFSPRMPTWINKQIIQIIPNHTWAPSVLKNIKKQDKKDLIDRLTPSDT